MTTLYDPTPVTGAEVKFRSYEYGGVPATFDVFLYQPRGRGPLLLKIKLRLQLRPLPPGIKGYLDANNKAFDVSPWTGADWKRYVAAAATQADMWNNKFWLLPPPTFTDFDTSTRLTAPDQAWRPNIRCELDVDFDASGPVHKTIYAANLDLTKLAGQPQIPGTFRSSAIVWDSLDGAPWVAPYGTGSDQPARHPVIAHEIGHLIGLGHIGTILKTSLCVKAIELNAIGKDSDPLMQGGRNSFNCYGHGQGLAVAGNIMGAGEDFTVENALPWRWSMAHLRKLTNVTHATEYWRAVTTDPGPGTYVKVREPYKPNWKVID